MLNNLENKLGLHQYLQVIYVVDGYLASLNNEQDLQNTEAEGSTLIEALINLDLKLTK
jgi:hypothetical protein